MGHDANELQLAAAVAGRAFSGVRRQKSQIITFSAEASIADWL